MWRFLAAELARPRNINRCALVRSAGVRQQSPAAPCTGAHPRSHRSHPISTRHHACPLRPCVCSRRHPFPLRACVCSHHHACPLRPCVCSRHHPCPLRPCVCSHHHPCPLRPSVTDDGHHLHRTCTLRPYRSSDHHIGPCPAAPPAPQYSKIRLHIKSWRDPCPALRKQRPTFVRPYWSRLPPASRSPILPIPGPVPLFPCFSHCQAGSTRKPCSVVPGVGPAQFSSRPLLSLSLTMPAAQAVLIKGC